MITAWMTQIVPGELGPDTAEDLASLVVAMSDGMIVGSQIYPNWGPEEYVDLLAGAIGGIAHPSA